MTKDEAIEALGQLVNKKYGRGWDKESIHIEADKVLLNFLIANGHDEVAEAYLDLENHVEGFWYA